MEKTVGERYQASIEDIRDKLASCSKGIAPGLEAYALETVCAALYHLLPWPDAITKERTGEQP